MASRDVVTLNETVGRVEVPQVGDTYRLPADTDVQGNQTVSGNQTVAGTATHQGQVVVGGVSRNTWPTPGSAAVAIDDVLKNGQVSTRRMELGGYAVSAIRQSLPIASFVDHDFFDNTDDAAWIDRQGHTSWENEVRHVGVQFMAATYANDAAAIAANSSIVSGNLYFNGTNFIEYGTATVRTRGSSRKFPMRGVVTAEATRVIIWSTTGGKPEMWMVFEVNLSTLVEITPTSVKLSKGILVVGEIGTVSILNFVSDSQRELDTTTTYTNHSTIQERNTPSAYLDLSTTSIVNAAVKDVAITYLPDAPLDEYGMKIPTMPHGTAAGGGWITQDGSVAQLTGAIALISTDIDQRGRTLFASASKLYVFNSVGTATAALTTADYTFDTAGTAGPHISGVISRVRWSKDTILVATSTGLFTIVYNEATPAQSIVTQVSSVANTGGMVGGIRGCWGANSLTADRSVKNIPLVTGVAGLTLTPVSTGSDLTCFTGDGVGYQKILNANASHLNFTTELFSLRWWQNLNNSTSNVRVARMTTFNTHGWSMDTGNEIVLVTNQAGAWQVTRWAKPLDNVWSHCVLVRTSISNFELYLNDVLQAKTVNGVHISPATSPVDFEVAGTGTDNTTRLPSGSKLALIHVSATSPTAEQIAYMYKTEAPLFQAGAQALLSNSSNVTDLRYDKKTDQYTVQNGTKTDLFSGLQRVASKLTTATDYTASNTAAIEAPAVTSLSGNVLNVPAVDVASELAVYRQVSRRVLLDFNVVVNGKFSSTSGWVLIGDASISGGTLSSAGAASTSAKLAGVLKDNVLYNFTVTFSITSGTVNRPYSGSGSTQVAAVNGTQSYTADNGVAGNHDLYAAFSSGGSAFTVDNLYVRESADTLPMGFKPTKVWAGGTLQEEGTDYDVTFDGFLYGISFFIEPATNIQVEGEQV